MRTKGWLSSGDTLPGGWGGWVAGETRGYFGVDVKAGPRGRGKVGVLEGEVGV